MMAGEGEPGQVIALDEQGPVVACGDQAVLITELQMPGKRRMSAADWLRGRPVQVGDRFN